MPRITLTKEQITKDIQNKKCVLVDDFYVYKDKVVQYTDHFGYSVNNGTLDKVRGYLVVRSKDGKTFAISHLKAKAFLANGRPIYSIEFKDGDCKNTDLNNLIIQYKRETRYCEDCGSVLSPGSTGPVCIKCKGKNSKYNRCSSGELDKRKERMKNIDLNYLTTERRKKVELYLKGHTLEYIAEQFGTTKQAISSNLQQVVRSAAKKKIIENDLNFYRQENERLRREITSLSELVNEYIRTNADIESKVETLMALAKDLNQENARLKNFVRQQNKKLTTVIF